MALELKEWDSAKHLKTEEHIAAYLEACFEEAGDDPIFIAHALGVVARARGMSDVANRTGLNRENLYRALSGDGNPEFGTILKVLSALGLQITVKQANKAE